MNKYSFSLLILISISVWGCNTGNKQSDGDSASHKVIFEEFEDVKDSEDLCEKKQTQLEPIYGDEACCVDSILESMDSNRVVRPVFVKAATIRNKDGLLHVGNHLFRSKEVKDFLQSRMPDDTIKVYRLSYKNKDYYLFLSYNSHATGLACYFNQWLLIDVKNKLVREYDSMSDDYRTFYLDKKTNELHHISFGFDDCFILQDRRDTLIFKLKHITIAEKGDSIEENLIEEKSSLCLCD